MREINVRIFKSVGKIQSINDAVLPGDTLVVPPSPLNVGCSPSQRVSRGGAFCANENIINPPDFWEKLSKKPLCNSPGLVSLISDHCKVLIKALGFLPRKQTSRQFFAPIK